MAATKAATKAVTQRKPSRQRGKGGGTGSRPTQDETLDRVLACVKIRRDGGTWQDCADAGHYSDKSNAQKAVTAFLRTEVRDGIEELRLIQHMRYEELYRDLSDLAARQRRYGIMDATDRVLTLMRDYNKFQGLNAPTKIELTDEMDREIQALAAQMEDGTWGITDATEGKG